MSVLRSASELDGDASEDLGDVAFRRCVRHRRHWVRLVYKLICLEQEKMDELQAAVRILTMQPQADQGIGNAEAEPAVTLDLPCVRVENGGDVVSRGLAIRDSTSGETAEDFEPGFDSRAPLLSPAQGNGSPREVSRQRPPSTTSSPQYARADVLGSMAYATRRMRAEDKSRNRESMQAALLGVKEDADQLVATLRRFSRDDLADNGDDLEAAFRMQVHILSRTQMLIRIILTCGLWLVFRPLEDQSVLVLTKKGRIIFYGKTQEAEAKSTDAYLRKVMRTAFVATLMVIGMGIFVQGSSSLRLQSAIELRGFVTMVILLMPVFCAYLYAQRPRRDCGSTFRQHFEVSSLIASSYIRVDYGRELHRGCARRRVGQLRLVFGKRYPAPESMEHGLPRGIPDIGAAHVSTVCDFPPAMAGEKVHIEEESRSQRDVFRGRSHLRVYSNLLAGMAAAGFVATFYDYATASAKILESVDVCSWKVKGCRWKIDNHAALGKERHPPSSFPPQDYHAGRCTDDGTWCDHFYRPTDYCSASREISSETTLRLPCKELPRLRSIIVRRPQRDAGNQAHIWYTVMATRAFPSQIPPGQGSGTGAGGTAERDVILESGSVVTRVGAPDSPESHAVAIGGPVDFAQLADDCPTIHGGAIEMEFAKLPEQEPLYEEDCTELQEACFAESFGPGTSGWWPPHRWFRSAYVRTVCPYEAMDVKISNPFKGRVWRTPPNSDGAICHGEPLQRMSFGSGELRNYTDGQKDPAIVCKAKCESRSECTHVFFGWPPRSGKPSDRHLASMVCWLYAGCPAREKDVGGEEQFTPVACDGACDKQDESCRGRTARYRTFGATNSELSQEPTEEDCRRACAQSKSVLAECNSFAFSSSGNASCTIYGPPKLRPVAGWKWKQLPKTESGSFQEGENKEFNDGTACWTTPRRLPPDRMRSPMPGYLMELTNKYMCQGCLFRASFDFFSLPSNFVGLLSNLAAVSSFIYVSRKVRELAKTTAVRFSGTSIIDMRIVQDFANPEDFEERERALRTIMARCHQLCYERGRQPQADETDVWEQPAPNVSRNRFGTDPDVREDTSDNFDFYELSDSRRSTCYVNKELLGIIPGEKVRAVWSETKRHGFIIPVAAFLVYLLVLWLLETCFPEHSKLMWGRRFTKLIILVVVPSIFWLAYYTFLRREVQGMCVLTNYGRIIQLLRRPPPLCFGVVKLGFGASLRLDSYQVGTISIAQVDMPVSPLPQDQLRARSRRAWRRGIITVRGEHGLMQVPRLCGDVLTTFRGLTESFRPNFDEIRHHGLRTVGSGGMELCGLCPALELLTAEEKFIWEKKLDAYGLIGDAFNYSSLMTISDCRLLVTRARCPKPLSMRGLCLGPLTCGQCCHFLQEVVLGKGARITATSVSHDVLESYATVRSRRPPLWPGFGKPIASMCISFMGKYMQSYPSALMATQRPYGMPRSVVVNSAVQLAATPEGALQVAFSRQPGLPQGHVVVGVQDACGRTMDLQDKRWSARGGVLVGKGTKLQLEAGDPEWDTYADEPWLRQLRHILDHVLGKAEAPDEAWDIYEAPEPRPQVTAWNSLMTAVMGGEMLGQPASSFGLIDGSGHQVMFPDDSVGISNASYHPL